MPRAKKSRRRRKISTATTADASASSEAVSEDFVPPTPAPVPQDDTGPRVRYNLPRRGLKLPGTVRPRMRLPLSRQATLPPHAGPSSLNLAPPSFFQGSRETLPNLEMSSPPLFLLHRRRSVRRRGAPLGGKALPQLWRKKIMHFSAKQGRAAGSSYFSLSRSRRLMTTEMPITNPRRAILPPTRTHKLSPVQKQKLPP